MPAATSAAGDFLQKILDDDRGLGLLYSPDEELRSEVVRHFLASLPPAVAVADIDGARLSAAQFLTGIFEQFGFEHELVAADDLLKMLEVVVVHQTRSNTAPVLVIRHLGAMYPGCLAALCRLASLRADGRYALRILLVADGPLHRVIDSPNMAVIAERLIGRFDLERPGDREFPQLFISLHGELVQQFEMTGPRTLIGRSEICEIVLEDVCVSRLHVLLINDNDVLTLFDLRSRNGTTVNSISISTRVLRDSDVVAISDYRLKVALPVGYNRSAESADSGNTAKMKHIADVGRAREDEDASLTTTERGRNRPSPARRRN